MIWGYDGPHFIFNSLIAPYMFEKSGIIIYYTL